MSIREHQCVTVLCDDCGDSYWGSSEGGIPHWPSAEEARQALVDEAWGPWQVTDDADLCPECVTSRACAGSGHNLSVWMPLFGTVGDDVEYRTCTRDYCTAGDYRHNGEPVDIEQVLTLRLAALGRGESR